jgi:hypothetical protein
MATFYDIQGRKGEVLFIALHFCWVESFCESANNGQHHQQVLQIKAKDITY